MNREELRDAIEEHLQGNCICDFITKQEKVEILAHVDAWLKTAASGDTYYYDGWEYTLEIEYGIAVWRDEEQREVGEPTYMTPTCSSTNLDEIKREVEKYDISANGCAEIFEEGEDDFILHYENGEWTAVD